MKNKKLGKTLKKFYGQKEDVQEILFGELGIPINGVKRVDVPGRAGYVYVRLRGNKSELVQAYNNTVPSKYNYPVVVSRKGNTYVIAGRDQGRYSNMGNIGNTIGTTPLPNHGGQHSFNPDLGMGADPVWVYSRQFMPMLSYPSGTSMTLATNPYFYEYNGQWAYTQSTGTPDFSSYAPTSGSAKMLLYWLDARDNSYKITAGADFSEDLTSAAEVAPYIPVSPVAYSIPLMAVRLSSGTTSLSWDNMYDVRPFLHVTTSGTASSENWLVHILPTVDVPSASTGTWIINPFSGEGQNSPFAVGSGMGYYNSSEAQNNSISWDVDLSAGTWNASIWVRKSTNTCIITLNVDGASAGTADTYNGSVAYTTVTITGFTVATSGKHTLEFKAATKNGSSSGYVLVMFSIGLRRTA